MSLVGQIAELQNYDSYKELSWEGSVEDYLDIVRRNPRVTRNAYQRLHDMSGFLRYHAQYYHS